MERTDSRYQAYMNILKEELIPAMGCTEPIALAYGAAVARQELGALPDRVVVGVSGSILKNVKSVIVPNTGHMKGIAAAAAAGIVAGDVKKELEVISQVSEEQIKEIREFLDRTDIRVEHIDNGLMFEILITMYKGEDWSRVRIANYHTNVVLIEKNGVVKKEVKVEGESEKGLTDRSCLSMEGIWDFINTADLDDLKQVLKRQASYNMAIAKEGMTHSYGANVGKSLASCVESREADSDTDISILARAMAAAGSDARMDGCELPVVINSGSGNQGITVSVPVLVYADRLHAGEEKTYRALALSNLTAIYQKTPIGRLSAFCGAVSAGAGAGAGIAYLKGGDFEAVCRTVSNTLAVTPGMICDGAKPSCAGKIAMAVEAGIMGCRMNAEGEKFLCGDGIVGEDADETISNTGRVAREGMRATNDTIIKIMIGD